MPYLTILGHHRPWTLLRKALKPTVLKKKAYINIISCPSNLISLVLCIILYLILQSYLCL